MVHHTTTEQPRPAETLADRLLSETTIGLSAAAALLGVGRGNRPIHPATLTRWILRGIRGPDGQRIKLEGVRVGSSWRTSREAVARFVDALTPGAAAAPITRTPTARRRASERAEEELIRAGC